MTNKKHTTTTITKEEVEEKKMYERARATAHTSYEPVTVRRKHQHKKLISYYYVGNYKAIMRCESKGTEEKLSLRIYMS